MKDWILDETELTDQVVKDYLEELGDSLNALVECNRLEKLGKDMRPYRKHYRHSARETLTELNHVCFNGHKEKIVQYFEDYKDEL